MTVTIFPRPRRQPIEDPSEIAAIESAISAIHGLIVAGGGFVAIAGRELTTTPVAERARLLTAMYDEGEVVFGWRDGTSGAVINVVIEKLSLEGGGGGWRAELFREAEDGHAPAGALAAPTAAGLGDALLSAASTGLAGALPSANAALLALRSD